MFESNAEDVSTPRKHGLYLVTIFLAFVLVGGSASLLRFVGSPDGNVVYYGQVLSRQQLGAEHPIVMCGQIPLPEPIIAAEFVR